MVLLSEVIKEMESFAPISLKEDFDNVGLMVGDKNNQIKKVLLALDCTMDVIDEAKDKNIDLIITHHPLIFRKPSNITTDTLQGKKIMELIKNNISLYSSHTNLDSAYKGINYTIAKLIGLENSSLLSVNKNDNTAGIGRIGDLDKEYTLEEYVRKVMTVLNVKSARVVNGNSKVKKVAVINGSGQDFIGKAISLGADTIITGDTTYHFASDYKEMGINIIDIGHFSSEWLPFLEVMKNIKDKFSDIEFIESEKSEDPYTFVI